MPSIALSQVDIDFTVEAERHRTLKSALGNLWRRPRREAKTIHALRSISLEIGSRERVGLIGLNGAGKSTLLKVLARIYRPLRGDVKVAGHVCPLFEFATGFEMDASGWENIRTRALLLGMPSAEIERKLDEIGQFTGLDEFLDYPVRCYSAGMLLRLAFATSTAVDPEILLLDEVMAAGDVAFIDQATARLNQLVQRASIVVFASHNLSLIPQFCPRTIWLDHGMIAADGPTAEVIGQYLDATSPVSRISVAV